MDLDIRELVRVPWQDLTAQDVARVRETIAEHQGEIKSIEQEIGELARTIGRLRAKQEQHRTVLANCTAVLSAVRRLPTDVLADIIECCVAAGWWRAPHVLSRLNSAWFQASRAARVWATLYIDAEDEDTLLRTRFWLRKARGCALDVTLRPSSQEHATAAVMCVLRPYGGQIRRLVIDSSSVDEVDLVLSHCPPKMEAIETLEIATQAPFPGAPTPELDKLRDVFEHSLRLNKLHLRSNALTPFVSLPATIQTLKITLDEVLINMVTFTQILLNVVFPALPHLRDLDLEIFADDYDLRGWAARSNDIQVCTVNSLQALRLHASPDFNVLLDKLSCPALRSLTLSSSIGSGPIPDADTGASLVTFLRRCFPPLTLLSLHDVDIPNSAFRECFGLLPALEELRLHWSDISVETLDVLARGDACPDLVRLDLRWCSHLEGGVLVDLVRNRKEASAAVGGNSRVREIEEIAVLNCPVVEEGDVLELAALTTCRVTLRSQGDPCRAYHSYSERAIPFD
jgi:hypothetical protein